MKSWLTIVLGSLAALLSTVSVPGAALAQAPIKIGIVQGLTGPFEVYAKQMVAGFKLGLEYGTGGKMEVGGRKIELLIEDDQLKPDVAKQKATKLYADDKVDLVVGTTSSAAALAILPVAQEFKKVLVVEPAVADSITGEHWNRYIFRTGAARARTRPPMRWPWPSPGCPSPPSPRTTPSGAMAWPPTRPRCKNRAP
jgi:branched-chain amino acid transport system substrate-binding protein